MMGDLPAKTWPEEASRGRPRDRFIRSGAGTGSAGQCVEAAFPTEDVLGLLNDSGAIAMRSADHGRSAQVAAAANVAAAVVVIMVLPRPGNERQREAPGTLSAFGWRSHSRNG
jgi:hypothetical protein